MPPTHEVVNEPLSAAHARAARQNKERDRQELRRRLREFREHEAVRFIHVRPAVATSQFGGGVTVCYGRPSTQIKSNLVEVSVAWCHPNESFVKLAGCKMAMITWQSEQRILMRVADKHHVAFELERIFQCALDGAA